ncbi:MULTISPECIES: DUF397 domain-containing protein [unclassified Streptomyces]|uniref:DUF397 domain-containing protein n=1 Tax=unclassified Streptomyces TaxID=2593676 RepID=UPI001BEC5FB1|nr:MULTISPECIES: DUF397 domain-containing protein [unclassified Streptomyces]MBT2404500.1 DUF397 domain-containing protein [Streptomyces sp. ISL-21]MBT2456945.1 DUF397 domain-containing protein [Streptomyces sp. ISL-86]MBT2608791.1 DUF397 domain-containing protein [Streptomyces sp. ISL-87]
MPTCQWWKSSYSGDGSNCVCVAVAPDGTVRLGDSKAPETVVAASAHALRTFIGAVVAGRLGRS